jgi:hypothetical protein
MNNSILPEELFDLILRHTDLQSDGSILRSCTHMYHRVQLKYKKKYLPEWFTNNYAYKLYVNIITCTLPHPKLHLLLNNYEIGKLMMEIFIDSTIGCLEKCIADSTKKEPYHFFLGALSVDQSKSTLTPRNIINLVIKSSHNDVYFPLITKSPLFTCITVCEVLEMLTPRSYNDIGWSVEQQNSNFCDLGLVLTMPIRENEYEKSVELVYARMARSSFIEFMRREDIRKKLIDDKTFLPGIISVVLRDVTVTKEILSDTRIEYIDKDAIHLRNHCSLCTQDQRDELFGLFTKHNRIDPNLDYIYYPK